VHAEGLEDLWIRVKQHRHYLDTTGELQSRRKQRLEREIIEIAERRLRVQVLQPRSETDAFRRMLDQVVQREMDPYQAAETMVPRSVATRR
jgi:LAO/AO transport system kinase